MDPLTTFGLAANILQFLSFGHEIFSSARQISKSTNGTSVEVHRLKALVASINENVKEVTQSLRSDESQDKQFLCDIAQGCEEVANKLLTQLGKLGTSQKGLARRLNAAKIATVFALKKDEIYELKSTLLELESRLDKWWKTKMERYVIC
jgi:hypothetical protein